VGLTRNLLTIESGENPSHANHESGTLITKSLKHVKTLTDAPVSKPVFIFLLRLSNPEVSDEEPVYRTTYVL
jgi:hypothetical protein